MVECLWMGGEGDLFRETLPKAVLESAEIETDRKDENEDEDDRRGRSESEDDDKTTTRRARARKSKLKQPRHPFNTAGSDTRRCCFRTLRSPLTESYRVALEIITTPPVMTATSRIAVWICTGMRSTKALARNAPGTEIAPIRTAKASTCAVTTPERPNTEILMMRGHTEITASVAITAAPSRPTAISSDSRITPEPEVPPTTTP